MVLDVVSREAIRSAVDVDGLIDRLLDAGDRLDAHPLQQSGTAINELERDLCHVVMRWCQKRGIEVPPE